MQLSKNLALAEVMRSETAKRKGISNMPTPEHIENFKKLAENVFQPIRDHFGVPIHLSSGYRSAALNKAVGGASSSQHCTGEAIDIDMDGTTITNAQIFNYIKVLTLILIGFTYLMSQQVSNVNRSLKQLSLVVLLNIFHLNDRL
jgi:zinc D-Ala-D-Ala carboxypeptidase